MRRIAGACCLLVLFSLSHLYAQCGYQDNGYIFLHPFFSGKNWLSTIFTSDVIAGTLCEDKPVRFAVSGDPHNGGAVFTTTDDSWMLAVGPLDDGTCLCCRPAIEYGPPVELDLPEGISSSVPFCIYTPGNGDAGSVYLVAASAGGTLYGIEISTQTGEVAQVDSLTVSLEEEQSITGVWGAPGNSGNDTAVWITGSEGLVRLIQMDENRLSSEQQVTFDNDETVLCVGGGYAGTASGNIYRRDGDAFILDTAVADVPVRRVSSRLAVGDDGLVVVRRDGRWQKFTSGSSDYRYGNLTANAEGTAVELLDSEWNYTSDILFDTETSITGVDENYETGLNSGVYKYEEGGLHTVTVELEDADDNMALPLTVLRRGGGDVDTLRKAFDGTMLLPNDPSLVCNSEDAYFTDSEVKVIFDAAGVMLETAAEKGGPDDAGCGEWELHSYLFKAETEWEKGDTLVLTAGSDTFRVVNLYDGAVTSRRTPVLEEKTAAVFRYFNDRIHVTVFGRSKVGRLTVINAAGRLVWQRQIVSGANGAVVSPLLPSGVLFIRIDYSDGRTEVRRLMSFGH